jgi:hypothetical protein
VAWRVDEPLARASEPERAARVVQVMPREHHVTLAAARQDAEGDDDIARVAPTVVLDLAHCPHPAAVDVADRGAHMVGMDAGVRRIAGISRHGADRQRRQHVHHCVP